MIGQPVEKYNRILTPAANLHPVNSEEIHQEVIGYVQGDGTHLIQERFDIAFRRVVGDIYSRPQCAEG